MPKRFYLSYLNPLHFTPAAPAPNVLYGTRHINDWPYPDTVRYWQVKPDYAMPWLQADTIKLQLTSQVGPITATLLNLNGSTAAVQALVQVRADELDPTNFIYELTLPLGGVPDGYYNVVLEFGSPVGLRLISNLLEIAPAHGYTTVLLEYTHFRKLGGVYFQTGFAPSMRTFGDIVPENPESTNTLFDNGNVEWELLDAKPFQTWRYWTGGPEGTPDFLTPKLNWILGCSDLLIDGRGYTKATEGSQLEKVEEKDYPLKGFSIKLRERLNRAGQYFEEELQNTHGVYAAIAVDSRAFIEGEGPGFLYQISDVE